MLVWLFAGLVILVVYLCVKNLVLNRTMDFERGPLVVKFELGTDLDQSLHLIQDNQKDLAIGTHPPHSLALYTWGVREKEFSTEPLIIKNSPDLFSSL